MSAAITTGLLGILLLPVADRLDELVATDVALVGTARRGRAARGDRSAWTTTSSGAIGGCVALPTDGRSIWPGFTSGAVTMKITSSTSITSMYGTTLISFIRRRRGTAFDHHRAGLPLQDVGELLHEALEADREPVDVVRVAVVGDHRRNRREQADGGGDQRLGDAGRHLRERRLLHVRQAAEGVHDAPHRAEQADVGAHRADEARNDEVRLEVSISRW